MELAFWNVFLEQIVQNKTIKYYVKPYMIRWNIYIINHNTFKKMIQSHWCIRNKNTLDSRFKGKLKYEIRNQNLLKKSLVYKEFEQYREGFRLFISNCGKKLSPDQLTDHIILWLHKSRNVDVKTVWTLQKRCSGSNTTLILSTIFIGEVYTSKQWFNFIKVFF